MEDEHGDPTGSVQTVGIINALKTGNVVLDMIIAMSIPMLMKTLFNLASSIQDMVVSQLSKSDEMDDERGFWARLFYLLCPFGEWRKKQKKHERKIAYRSVRRSYGGSINIDDDSRNNVLIKAIQLYLDHHQTIQLNEADLMLTSIQDKSNSYYDSEDEDNSLASTLTKKYKVVKKPRTDRWHEIGMYGGQGVSHAGIESSKGSLQKHKVELWIQVEEGKPLSDPNNAGGGQPYRNVTLYFRSAGSDSIDDFIETAYRWYIDELRKYDDNSRYLYEMQTAGNRKSDEDSESSESEGHVYKRYKLSDEKTFESMFFEQKSTILKTLDHFTEKSGKYAIPGFPHKLGLLLHGPPGTGKTSLIKALAHRTGRSIVNVPLSKIQTNQELMSIFFDQNFRVKGEDFPVKLGFKDVIYVMEDVDAASRVVRSRDGRITADVTATERLDVPTPKSLWQMLMESQDDTCRELVTTLIEKSARLKEAAFEPRMMRSLAKRMALLPGLGVVGDYQGTESISNIGEEAVRAAENVMESYQIVDSFVSKHAGVIKAMIDAGAEVDQTLEDELLGRSFDDLENVGAPSLLESKPAPVTRDVSWKKYGGKQIREHSSGEKKASLERGVEEAVVGMTWKDDNSKIGPSPSSAFLLQKDRLNLSGLLNALDGVVDTPGRIVIMTTNHPEVLDRALTRPGRIDMKLMLGYMSAEDVLRMIELYFQVKPTEEQITRVTRAIKGNEALGIPAIDLTPAQVEQMASEHDELDNMIVALEAKGISGLSGILDDASRNISITKVAFDV